MENEDNILKRIKEILGGTTANFSILEHQVDIKIQMEYFEYSKAHRSGCNSESCIEHESKLYSGDTSEEEVKRLLVCLASVEKPEAYRILERFTAQASYGLKDWAILATQESRMLLETQLLDEQQVFISTGLGGKGNRLRYFVVVFSLEGKSFTSTQQNLIVSEFKFMLKRSNSEIEEITFLNNYCAIIALVPLSVKVRQPFQSAIEECNSIGQFIRPQFLITNVKILDSAEIEELQKTPPESKDEE